MRGACQTLQGHTKKRQVTLMPKSLRMPCQLGGPRFLMPPRVALAAWCLLKAWQDYQFCNVHKTGFFCDGTTRIRCCKLEDGYAKCGSTANSGTCAAEKPDLSKLKSLGFYKTRQASSFCQRQLHVGTYCYKHRYVYCCNYGAGVVECQPQHQSGRWCMDVFL